MKLFDQPIARRAEILSGLGVHVDTIDEEKGTIAFRLPGFLGLPLTVDGFGRVDFARARANQGRAEFSVDRQRTGTEAARELISDVFGFERPESLAKGLHTLGWKPLAKLLPWPGEPVRLMLIEGPPSVVACVRGRLASIDTPPADELPEHTRAIAERRLALLQGLVDDLNREREHAEPSSVQDYLPRVSLTVERMRRGRHTIDVCHPWNTLFSRSRAHPSGLPMFYVRDSASDLYAFDGYMGGHEVLDRILSLIGTFDFTSRVSGGGSPGCNVAEYQLKAAFLDGGLRVVSGNYMFGSVKQGAHVVGCRALRFVLWHLGCAQPRRLGGERRVPTPWHLARMARFPQDCDDPEAQSRFWRMDWPH